MTKEDNKTNNNIFTYATSELSQDAFLFYLLNFANKNSNEGKLARQFLNSFCCNKINENNYDEFKIYSYKQYKHIDVLILFLNKKDINNSFLLVLEDKTNSNESKENQLNSYVEKIKEINQKDINGQIIDNEKIKEAEFLKQIIVPIYLKTGTMSIEEKEYIKQRNKLIDLDDICRLIKNQNTDDCIINQWKERITRLEELNKKIQAYIEEDKTIGNIYYNLCQGYGCDSLEAMNQLGRYIFDKCKVGAKSKFYNNNDTYNYNTWKENAMGHPEANLSIKPDLLYKKLDNAKCKNDDPSKEFVFSTQIRIRNFDLCIIFETLIIKDSKYFDYGRKSFFDNNSEIKDFFNSEKEKFYKKFYEKASEIIKSNPKFNDTTIGNMGSRNIILAKFNWEDGVENLKVSDFKEYVLKLQDALEEVAVECGFEKMW